MKRLGWTLGVVVLLVCASYGWAQPCGDGEGLGRRVQRQDRLRAAPVRVVPSKLTKFLIEVVDSKGRGVSDAIVIVSDPDSDELPDSYTSGFDGGHLLSFVTDAEGRVKILAKAQRQGGLSAAKKLRVIMLRYGAKNPERTFVLAEHDGVLRLEVPTTIALTFLAPRPDPSIPSQDPKLFWAAGAKSPLGATRHLNFYPGVRKSDLVDRYCWNWSLRVPSKGRRVRAFAPHATITTLVRHPGRVDLRATHQLGAELEQTLELSAGMAKARLRIKLVDDAGELFPFRAVAFQLVDAKGLTRYLRFGQVDASGSAEVDIDPGFRGRLHLISGAANLRRQKDQSASALVSFEIANLKHGEVTQLGEVVIPRPQSQRKIK
ncbi:MAG: hypothetical protein V3W41_01785 [Planctomycetota bacterium]